MKFVLTNAGKEYLARVNAGEIMMHLSRVMTGAGYASYPDILQDLSDPKQQIQLDEVHSQGYYTNIVCVLTNLELETEYVLKQIGIFAWDEAGEKLIIIGQDAYGDRIPAITEKEVEYQYNIGMQVSNASEVLFDFSVNDFLRKKYFYEHLEDFETYKDDIQKQFSDLPRVKVGSVDQLDRKDTLLFETIPGTDKVTQIRERDAADQRHLYKLAAIFDTPPVREELQSEDTLEVLFGKIKRYLLDLKPDVYQGTDGPLTMMTESSYKAPPERMSGHIYGLITKMRGLIIFVVNRYVTGTEDPRQERTLYLIEKEPPSRTAGAYAENPYKGILHNLIMVTRDSTEARATGKLYGIETKTKGVSV